MVQCFLRNPSVFAKFDELFSGKGPAALFVHYQRVHWNVVESPDQKATKQTKKSELFVSFGDSVLMNSKCCYFLRNGSHVDSSLASDPSLFYGEIVDSSLDTFKSLLSFTYAPLFSESSEWGDTNEEQKAEFKDELNKFVYNLTSAIESISGGLELIPLSLSHAESLDPSDNSSISQNPEAITHVVEMLEQWCGQIAKFISTRETASNQHDFGGPKGEIEYWRARTRHLSSIIEQFKRNDCRFAVGILSSFAKGANEPEKSNTISLMRRWKQIDIETTEAFNEARDNLKYLSTLQRFIEPLYSGTAQSINDSLPALINSVKVAPN
jgi:dynein heavy chain